jgi:hypothetical protein
MKESMVKQTINALKRRLEDNGNIIQVQTEEGYLYDATCTFHPPVTDEDIIKFEKETGFILPKNYREFLKITNGCRLFDDIYGGEIELYSLEQIKEYNSNRYDEFEGCYDIAYIYQDNIVINSKLVSQKERNSSFTTLVRTKIVMYEFPFVRL